MRCCILLFLSLLIVASAFDFENSYHMAAKRGGMGGYAFGSMDKMLPAHFRKFMRNPHKRASGSDDYLYR
ncbi:hypothetical protein PFISCL1PPCAC_17471 [Pristionchus fissidentatus]|uniref:Uncharacterized protein n=1 Tax=Pristionchus fissidentatus TaxID=1538716 RepID=A0AAV5W604_9BILA|nr:hypothetical protein PFISCL1PPCAC_17471 [Pristionchus fissidentatus]